MKENMQYATNDPYKLDSWDQEQLADWGVEVPTMETNINIDDFFNEMPEETKPLKGFNITITCPSEIADKKDEIINLISQVLESYNVKVKG